MRQLTFTLYTTPISANGRKVLAVAQQLKLNPEIKIINVYQGDGQKSDYLALNPFGKIPTLVDGDFILWESNAILQYMAEALGDYHLSSRDPKIRADISRWMFWESCHWQPTISTILANAVGHALVPHLVPPPSDHPDWDHPQFMVCAKYLNSHLQERQFLAGNELSIADFSIAGMMTYFRFGDFPFERFPYLSRWYEYIEQLEAWKNTQHPTWTS
jgi:glutathione S-transferase